MLQVFANANFRFMWGTKWIFMILSAAGLLISGWAIGARGFNYGIDFAGGTAVQVKFRDAPRVESVRAALEGRHLGDVNIQAIGEPEDYEVLIRVEQEKGAAAEGGEGGGVSAAILEALRSDDDRAALQAGRVDLNAASEASLAAWLLANPPGGGAGDASPATVAAAVVRARSERGGVFTGIGQVTDAPGVSPEAAALLRDRAHLGSYALRGVEFVGPTAGRELLRNTGYAILGSVLGILAYVWVRFHRWTWGLAAIAALVHDVTIAAGAMALTGKEFSLPVVAALLTILGYSINDTIVIFDRIRENLRLYREHDFEEVVNASVNQTLSRSVLTSFTVFIAVTALLMYGGDKLNPLSFCLLVGVVAGSYSTIFVASALLVIAYRRLGPRYVKA
ncbi:MAG: protein translocase subunit SecF [Candidatus Polarisedimenticolia bacterium]